MRIHRLVKARHAASLLTLASESGIPWHQRFPGS